MNNIGATGEEGNKEMKGKKQTNNVKKKGIRMEENVNERKIHTNKERE
jgi:hypothetical protein